MEPRSMISISSEHHILPTVGFHSGTWRADLTVWGSWNAGSEEEENMGDMIDRKHFFLQMPLFPQVSVEWSLSMVSVILSTGWRILESEILLMGLDGAQSNITKIQISGSICIWPLTSSNCICVWVDVSESVALNRRYSTVESIRHDHIICTRTIVKVRELTWVTCWSVCDKGWKKWRRLSSRWARIYYSRNLWRHLMSIMCSTQINIWKD